jgi:HSF-type DNA-binding
MDDDQKSISIAPPARMNSFRQQPQQKLNGSNSNSKAPAAVQSSSSRRVSMDSMLSSNLGGDGENPAQSQSNTHEIAAPHMIATTPLRRGSGPDRVATIDDCSPSSSVGGGGARAAASIDPSATSLLAIPAPPPPPSGGGGFLPRMEITRRSSAPGFYSSQNLLLPPPPFAPGPYSFAGMNHYPPFPSSTTAAAMPPVASRRASYAGGYLSGSNSHNNHMLFPPPPAGMMFPSMDGFPSMSFPNAAGSSSSMMMMGGGNRSDSTPSPSMDDGSGRGDDMLGGNSSQNSHRRDSMGSTSQLSLSAGDKVNRSNRGSSGGVIRRSRPSGVSSFPMKLHRILSDAEYRDYVAWLPHGRAWRILKQKTFEKEVIPKFFRSARYASFMRQVHYSIRLLME